LLCNAHGLAVAIDGGAALKTKVRTVDKHLKILTATREVAEHVVNLDPNPFQHACRLPQCERMIDCARPCAAR
jgi:hypothetical protein